MVALVNSAIRTNKVFKYPKRLYMLYNVKCYSWEMYNHTITSCSSRSLRSSPRLGGTGFVASNGKTGNYIDALQRGDWLLPYGSPPLVVIEGGGNDASRGATDQQISTNAERLIARSPVTKARTTGTALTV